MRRKSWIVLNFISFSTSWKFCLIKTWSHAYGSEYKRLLIVETDFLGDRCVNVFDLHEKSIFSTLGEAYFSLQCLLWQSSFLFMECLGNFIWGSVLSRSVSDVTWRLCTWRALGSIWLSNNHVSSWISAVIQYLSLSVLEFYSLDYTFSCCSSFYSLVPGATRLDHSFRWVSSLLSPHASTSFHISLSFAILSGSEVSQVA